MTTREGQNDLLQIYSNISTKMLFDYHMKAHRFNIFLPDTHFKWGGNSSDKTSAIFQGCISIHKQKQNHNSIQIRNNVSWDKQYSVDILWYFHIQIKCGNINIISLNIVSPT